MTQETKTRKKEVVQSGPVVEDLSAAIEQAVTKLPDEEIRIVKVFGDRYRCNWWVREGASSTMFSAATGRIRRSSFLRATKTGDKLVIEELNR